MGFLGVFEEPMGALANAALGFEPSAVMRKGRVMMWMLDVVLEASVGWSGGTNTPS